MNFLFYICNSAFDEHTKYDDYRRRKINFK